MAYSYEFPTRSVAFISGAASGMGRSTALVFAEAGISHICIADMNQAGLEETARQMKLPADNVLIRVVDLTKDQQVEDLFQDIIAKFGRLDYAINAAGVSGHTMGTLESVTQDDWDCRPISAVDKLRGD